MAAPQARFTVETVGDTLVRVRWSPAIVLEDTDGRLLTLELSRALPGHRAHLLMVLNGMVSLSQQALAYFANHAPLSAVALVGPSVVDEVLVEMYHEIYAPPFPVGYFEHESAALAWLTRQPTLG